MLINKFDIMTAMTYANIHEDINTFLQLETILIKNKFPGEKILVVDDDLLDYIENVHKESCSSIESDISQEKMICNSIDDEDDYPNLYNCNITDFYEDSLVRNPSSENRVIKKKKKY